MSDLIFLTEKEKRIYKEMDEESKWLMSKGILVTNGLIPTVQEDGSVEDIMQYRYELSKIASILYQLAKELGRT